ncbi:OmpA family protein [Amycolatopsis australiensis]|nr:OmpA family protein [Amycolatopsis australiensis]
MAGQSPRRTAIAGGFLVAAAVAGCAGHAREAATASGGDRVVIVAGATANEPRPALTEAALAVLRDAANSGNVSAQGSGKSSVALISAADGVQSRAIVLTPRRADGSLEHGFQRPSLVERNVRAAADAVAATAATHSGLDLLAGVDAAVRGVTPGTLVVVSSGLSTTGAFDLRQVGWDADPQAVAEQLAAKHELPRLAGWRVLFTGLGDVAGPQPPLPGASRDKLTQYWHAICAKAQAGSCDFDERRTPAEAPRASAATPVVPVPGVTSVVGPGGQVSTVVSDSALGFAGDSAALSPGAESLLRGIAASITARLGGNPAAPVTIRGYAADPPGSTAAGRQELAELRAEAVAGALRQAGVRQRPDVGGTGTEPGRTAMKDGKFDEAAAAAMRRVEITY